jgi:hypothetical protein
MRTLTYNLLFCLRIEFYETKTGMAIDLIVSQLPHEAHNKKIQV